MSTSIRLRRNVAFVGAPGTGKSCLLERMVKKRFAEDIDGVAFLITQSPSMQITTGPNSDYPQVEANYELVLLEPTLVKYQKGGCDSETFEHLDRKGYIGVDAFLLCFDDKESMKEIERLWLPDIKRFAPYSCCVAVGTKSDLRMSQPSANDFLISPLQRGRPDKLFGLKYVECSALTGDGLHDLIDSVTANITQRDSQLAERLVNRNRSSCCPLL